jgi:hypothetical protein
VAEIGRKHTLFREWEINVAVPHAHVIEGQMVQTAQYSSYQGLTQLFWRLKPLKVTSAHNNEAAFVLVLEKLKGTSNGRNNDYSDRSFLILQSRSIMVASFCWKAVPLQPLD